MSRYAHLAYTDTVREVQRERGNLRTARSVVDDGPDPLGVAEAAFIRSRDGFYMASVSETGWPYLQYRGGPQGFVHVLDEQTLAYADVRGNRQYITTGNLRTDDRVALFFMDYQRLARLKIFGHASVRAADEDMDLTSTLNSVRTDGRVERMVVIRVEGFNWNCSQHITRRFTEAELSEALAPVRDRLNQLEQENIELRNLLDAQR
ncbi:pyridoxamine 5'-phosphate oxidase family protein [Streptomyces sp900116325]|uniref:pyridoxamine 5'-phosphate oxidase family protein n=1 Tax=Streptomyces sp. 900116325 TaxID=3154295 RepID=UPI0033C0DABC